MVAVYPLGVYTSSMSTETKTRLDIPVEGMTCASCAGRVEKSLNGIDGVDASVNFALKRATVEYDETQTSHDELAAAVEHAGYTPHMPHADHQGEHAAH